MEVQVPQGSAATQLGRRDSVEDHRPAFIDPVQLSPPVADLVGDDATEGPPHRPTVAALLRHACWDSERPTPHWIERIFRVPIGEPTRLRRRFGFEFSSS